MTEAFICDAIRTPSQRYAAALAAVLTDDVAAPLERPAGSGGSVADAADCRCAVAA